LRLKSGMNTTAILIAASGLLLTVPTDSTAQAPSPAALAAAAGPLRLGMGYDGRFYIKVLEMDLDQEIGADSYRTSTHISTWGLGAVVKKLNQRANASGRLDGARTLPGVFVQQNNDGKRNRRVTTTWARSEVSTTAVPAYDDLGDPPASRAQKLAAADPLTQLVRVTRASTAEGPCNGDTHFFDGKQLYDFDFARPRAGGEPDAREKSFGLLNAVVCEVRFREVAGFKKKPPEERNQGLKSPISARFGQLGPGGPWILSSLKADTKWGRAVIDLRRLSVSGRTLAAD
jgi:hypothetical protein